MRRHQELWNPDVHTIPTYRPMGEGNDEIIFFILLPRNGAFETENNRMNFTETAGVYKCERISISYF